MGLKLAILDPALYIYRFAAHLDLDDKANTVAMTALRLIGRMKRDWIVAGRRPAGVCAAALLISSRAHGFSRDPQDVTRILRVCGMTVKNRVKEFEQTPSASLTLQQFNRVDLENEADPPSFTRNRMMEARARAIDENDVKLLTSGALDDPMKGENNMSKWRDGKTSKNNDAFEKLYKSLEEEMTKKGSEIPKDDTAKKTEANDNVDEGNKKDANKDEKEKESQNIQGENGKKSPEEHNQNKAMIISKSSNDDEQNMLSTNTSITQSKWEKAYPRRRCKKIILPDHSTPEELLPPTQPVEGTLDTAVWRKDMPQDMIDDMESIFRNPTEVAQKEAIFNKINKDYIIVQAHKEKKQSAAEQAKDNAEKDLVEQAQRMERYRKRKGRGHDSTTEEALLEVVANRKISRKINYDAMSSIFDDGSFSTGGAAEEGLVQEESLGMNELI